MRAYGKHHLLQPNWGVCNSIVNSAAGIFSSQSLYSTNKLNESPNRTKLAHFIWNINNLPVNARSFELEKVI